MEEIPLDLEHAIEIAPRIWWVGRHLPDDAFQCHSYLIEHGDQSVLIDPGSVLTFESTMRKIKEVVPLSAIRTIICHHQDPDITGILPKLDQLIARPDAVILSHWRANVLLKHLGLKTLPFQCVEKLGWHLDLGGRELRFIFTPYLHFSGAFCTFDEMTGTLFSSDIFGGLADNTPLYAQDEGAFEAIRTFHEHYMPSQAILQHGLASLEPLAIRLIAPQHGSLIPEPLVSFMINRLKELDCGLFLLTKTHSDYQRLSRLNTMLREMMQTIMVCRDFSEVASRILELAQSLISVAGMEFYTLSESGEILHLAPETSFRSTKSHPPAEFQALLGMDRDHWQKNCKGPYIVIPYASTIHTSQGTDPDSGLVLPLFSPHDNIVRAVVILRLGEENVINDDLAHILTELSVPLGVAVEREVLFRAMDQERQKSYDRSIRDPLTGLYTRHYMQEALTRLCQIHDRDPNATITTAAFDIDHFKSVNDTYGHAMGDVVLRLIAKILADNVRSVDIPVRIGGEEFVLFIIGASQAFALHVVERVRLQISHLVFDAPMHERTVTISSGIAFREAKESIEQTMERADRALYQAKTTGRNKMVVSS